ncbi:NAD-dependent epimerase/dehydratase family protein [Motilibacter deserti]|uniref:NAD-dependent epimerase/dehydratase family protein n=1 Tax=Motilibacter deserti TaxID=2714956 RepID=A0ABX0GVU1_9ACTN|nr:NAD-dependent epimerase/dehydratase family protein [Motilibacter deserti]NHC15058.1 NAD-dependent epimerase/dehydratase family protein [Motilibacter deserti]
MTLHVVLGSGPVGRTVAAELLRAGADVRIVDRRGEEAVPGAEPCAADLRDPDAAARAVSGADVVYHAVNVAYELQVEVMPQVQRAVLAGVAAAGARLVVMDTLYPYGPTGGAPMTESTPWNATSRKGRMRAELDAAYLEAHAAGRAQVSLGRAADFFGPGVLVSSLGGFFFPAALSGGTALAFGDLDLPHSYSYIKDVARGLVLLGAHPEHAGRVWHLPTAPALSTREVHGLVRELTGRAFDVEALDPLRPWGALDEVFVREYEELFYQYLEPQIMDSSAFEAAFGVSPTPLRTALQETVEWYARQPVPAH